MQTTNITPNYQEPDEGMSRQRGLLYLAIIGFLIAGIIIAMYIYMTRNRIYVEKSTINAQSIALSSKNGGILEKMMVNPGDEINADTPIAQVGQEIVKAKEGGLIISTQDDPGKTFSPGEAVAAMIRPDDLRVVAQVEEDKGLSDIKVGQRVIFTADAYGNKKYEGVVDEVSQTARQEDVVFNISSQRQLNEFNVKIRFDVNKYPELKNGMSAKAWIYTD